jgi:hypothetical protein
LSTDEASPSRIESLKADAIALEQADPDLVDRAGAECQAAAQRDLVNGVPRGTAIVLRLRDLTVERPPLGIAVARSLGLEHIMEELLAGKSVDGVTGISAEGDVLPPSPSDKKRRRGTVFILLGGVILLVGATTADSLSLTLVIIWTLSSFFLIFSGLRALLRRG